MYLDYRDLKQNRLLNENIMNLYKNYIYPLFKFVFIIYFQAKAT